MLLSLPKGLARVGCTAEIKAVVQRYQDGRMDILTAGRAPFRVVELFTEDPLLEGHVDYLDDRETPSSPRIQRELVELFEACHTLIFDDYPKNLQGAGTEELSYASDGPIVEAANSRAAVGRGSPGTPGSVSSRMGPASTEERGRAPARRRQWTWIELACGEPTRPACRTGLHDGEHIDALFISFETAHAGRAKAHS